MKNLSISKKLIVGFGTILFMLLISIAISIFSISGINKQVNSYVKYTLPNSTSIWVIRRNTVATQRDVASALAETDTKQIAKWFDSAQQDSTELLNELEKYAGNQRDTSRDANIAELRELFNKAGKVRQEIAALMQNPIEANMRLANHCIPFAFFNVSQG